MAMKLQLSVLFNAAHIHLRHINPLPTNLGALLDLFDNVLVPELNMGQLATLLRDRLCINVEQLNKVSGQPLTVGEMRAAIDKYCSKIVQSAS